MFNANLQINCLIVSGYARLNSEDQVVEIVQTLRRSGVNMDQCIFDLDSFEIWLTL